MVAQLDFENAAEATMVAVAIDAKPSKPRVVVRLEQNIVTAEVAEATEPVAMGTLTKVRLVERIIEMNPTASEQFLRVFSHKGLMDYMEHLASAQEPRGRNSSWLRRGDSPAILAREPRDE